MSDEKTIIDYDNNEVPEKVTPSRGRLILSKLTENQKQMIRKGTFTLSAIAASGGLYSMFNSGFNNASDAKIDERIIDGENEFVGPVEDNSIAENAVIYCEACFADSVSAEMSFQEAFGAARAQVGPGGFFEWRGDVYNTYYKEEWDGMTPEEHGEYWVSVTQSAEYDTLELVENRVNITDDGIHYVDLDNDGNFDYAMKDIDGDGELDMYQVDLNDDGNFDVIHGQPQESEEGIVIADEMQEAEKPNPDPKPQVPEIDEPVVQEPEIVEPLVGLGDLNYDDIPDAIATDTNNDGYADVVIADLDQDGIPESNLYNIDGDHDLDIVVVDYNMDGVPDGPEIEISQEVKMEDLIIVEEEDLTDPNLIVQKPDGPVEDLVDDEDVDEWTSGEIG